MNQFKHWTLETDEQQIAWLGLGREDVSVNSINDDVLDELNQRIVDLSSMTDIKGVVIYSTKPKGFIAGADVMSFSKFETKDRIVQFLQKGQTVFSRLEALNVPTVAMINGFCMGGGLELALACTYRIASDEPETRIGLPEVMLGIHPGWGGTVRLPRLIGGFNALTQVILTGAALPAKKAKGLGIIDDAVPVRQLKRAAIYYILNRPPVHKPTFLQKLSNHPLSRKMLASLMTRQIAKRVNQQHYPAPFAAVSLWLEEGAVGERAYHKEIDSIEHLITHGETSANLIRAFLLRERLKSFAKGNSNASFKHVHVIGAGVMGGDIAIWCAMKGFTVTLQDKSQAQIAPVISRAAKLYEKKLKSKRLVQAALDRIIPDPDGYGVGRADVIIEAVFENLEVKQTLFKQLEDTAKPDAILATNTSSIPLDEISVVMKDASRLVGIHFFNPVARMDLVEIVSSSKTSKKVAETASQFVGAIGKLPLPVKSTPGFLINRVLMPYLMECVALLEEGYSPEAIDSAAKDFGMMMGPVELADTVGMDVCLAVANNLTQHFGGTVPKKLQELVALGHLGKKTGEGFYKYKNGKPVLKKVTQNADDKDVIANRLILRMINEAAACLREGVVMDADLLDAGMIFATGFAPFRGGPMHYAKHFGHDKLNELFTKLEIEYGDRFKADVGL